MKYYLNEILAVEQLIEEYNEETNRFWFSGENALAIASLKAQNVYFLTNTQRYFWDRLNEIAKICDFFGIESLDDNKATLEEGLNVLYYPSKYKGELKTNFEVATKNIKAVFQNAKMELSEKISLLEEEEKRRLNEAFNCYIQELNYSSVVMSVSAIESRLFSLMMLKHYDKKLEDLTLGQLIKEYTDHKEKYDNVIPKKHEALLDYCNTYRVFSVHPKKEKITRAIATSILCMTCNFLFDKKLKAEIEEKKS